MNKQEFLDSLGRTLRREMSDQEAMEHLQYYDNYIEQEKAKGRMEPQILSELGDPRLIARTILQVDQQREEQVYGSAESVYTDDPNGGYAENTYGEETNPYGQSPFGSHVKVHNISKTKFWIIMIAILIVLFAILRTAFAIVWRLLPILLVAGIIYWLYEKYIKR